MEPTKEIPLKEDATNGVVYTAGSPHTPRFVYVVTLFATIGGFLFGYDTGIISGALLLIRPHFNLDTIWTELIVCMTVASAAFFSIFGGTIMDYIGRRRTIMLGSAVFTLGAIVMSSAPSKEALLVGRIITGASTGFGSICVTVYVAEVAPTHIRGALATCNQIFVAAGILLASIIAGLFSGLRETGWRYMIGLGVIPGMVQFIAFIFLPESPRWLIYHGHVDKAREVLMRIRGTIDVDEEVFTIKERMIKSKRDTSIGRSSSFWRVLTTPHVRRALMVGCTLQFFQQVCGINTVIYYSASIMQMAGFSVSHAIWLVVAPTTVNLLATVIGMNLIDRWGRRLLILTSITGVFVSLAVLASGFQLSSANSPVINVNETFGADVYNGPCNIIYSDCNQCTRDKKCGFCYDVTSNGSCLPVDPSQQTRSLVGRCNASDQSATDYKFTVGFCPNDYTWMPIVGMVLYVFFFAPGLAPVPWAVNSEIYPLWARGTCTSLAAVTNWVWNLIVSLTFLSLTEAITKAGTFWLFGGMCVLAFLFVLVYLPETKNKRLEEVEQLFMTNGSRQERIHLLKERPPTDLSFDN